MVRAYTGRVLTKALVCAVAAVFGFTSIAEAHRTSQRTAKRIAKAEAEDYAFGTHADEYGTTGRCKQVFHGWRCRVWVQYGDIANTNTSSDYCEWRVTVNHNRRARNGRKRCDHFPASGDGVLDGINRERYP